MNLSRPFIRRPIASILTAVAVVLLGAVAYRFLPVATLPQVDFPTIQVYASLPGASPETMAASVATPLERALGSVAGITMIYSDSRQGSCSVTLQFDIGRDIFVEASLAAALHDGKTGAIIPVNRLSLGCDTGTREAAALGFRLSDRWSLVTSLEHFSTAGCSGQPGAPSPRGPANFGAKLGYTF